MSFTLKNYIKRGLIAAVGKMADYQIILNSAGWMEKGVLSEDDLMEIQAAIAEQYKQQQAATIIGITNAITAISGDVTGTQEDKTWLITS